MVYIALPRQEPKSGGNIVGKLKKAMYMARDSPQIWGEMVKEQMTKMGAKASELDPAVYWCEKRNLTVLVCNEFLCRGGGGGGLMP